MKVLDKASSLYLRVDRPIYAIDKKELLEAVEFEFGMDYYNRVFVDLKKRALKVFSARYDLYVELGVVVAI